MDICFHSKIYDSVYDYCWELLGRNNYVEFLIGRNGTFDLIASAAINAARKNYGEQSSSLVLILPYLTAEYKNNYDAFNDFYSEIEIFEEPFYKSAISKRNKHMIDRSDMVVFYLERYSGGAYQVFKYAKKQNKCLINLNSENFDFDDILK